MHTYMRVYATTSALFLTLTKLPFVVCFVVGHAKNKIFQRAHFGSWPKIRSSRATILECLVECLCAGLSFDGGHTKLYRIYTKLMSVQFFDSLNIFLDQLVSFFYTPARPSKQPQHQNTKKKKKKSCLKILSPILSPPSHDRLVCVYTPWWVVLMLLYVVVVVAILELGTHCAWAVCIYHSARYRWGNLKADEVVFAVRNSRPLGQIRFLSKVMASATTEIPSPNTIRLYNHVGYTL